MDETEKQGFIAYTRLPIFKRRMAQSLAIIKEALAIDSAYVSVSWGKDSTVLLHLCQQVCPDILAVNFTSEWRDKIDNYNDVITSFLEIHPTNYREYVTDFPEGKNKLYWSSLANSNPVAFVGCRNEESSNRRISYRTNGAIYQYTQGIRQGTYRAWPLACWSWQDVWAYICSHDIPYLASYEHCLNQAKDSSRTAIIHKSKKGKFHPHVHTIMKKQSEMLKVTAPEFYREFMEDYYE